MAADLYRLAVSVSAKAYAPYSGLKVGAALATTDGRTYSGCNIENASYPEGWCAETSAISHMVVDGGGSIAEIAVYCSTMELITPCGGCRQRIAEFGNTDTLVHLCDNSGIAQTVTLPDLLPYAFDMKNRDVKE
ncbi:MAG: cytidine deaminase [Rhizobiaceae bacterium]